ncbi:MAG: YbjN domain-containing protein [Alphaproteobacteria bacterium]|nr:YbjN domain-containing protein [Alphaproteobacteria bacterium]MDP6814779.1 YbjN domain-containing protein [Alphaproteobacteria bacterium]
MTMVMSDQAADGANPLDVVEEIVSAHQWPFERNCDEELSVSVAGSWCDYHLGFSFSPGQGGLQLACAYDMRVPEKRLPDVHALLAMVNERMWLGHFDLWSEDGVPMYRHAVLTRGGDGPSVIQMEHLIEVAITECERFYPAFQFLIWGGKSPGEAIAAAMLETVGEA